MVIRVEMRNTPQDLKKNHYHNYLAKQTLQTINDTSKVINTDDNTTAIAESKIDVTLLSNVQQTSSVDNLI